MRLTILTFQFAHNYGALLQAYALKRYLEDCGHTVEIAPYCPEWAQKEYAISPFTKGISFRKRMRFFIQYPVRKSLANRFHQFIIGDLGVLERITTSEALKEYLNSYDCAIFGSDQIWNEHITGQSEDYFGGDITVKRISYAASLGTKDLTAWQKHCALEYLPHFRAVSVRETGSKRLLEKVLKKEIITVMDPVFLHDKEQWSKLGKPVEILEPFLILYFLCEDDVLLSAARIYAKEHGLNIYEVHPTLAMHHAGCTLIKDSGPKEFLWLIEHAECVCTNSFHATAFSVIFRKRLLHIPNRQSSERTTCLLEQLGYRMIDSDESIPLYDLTQRKSGQLERLFRDSKAFLLDAIKGE